MSSNALRSARTTLIRGTDLHSIPLSGPGFEGVCQTLLVDETHGSVHQEVVITELAPGGTIPGHFHPFEESFFLLDGSAIFAVNGQSYELRSGDYGFAPIAAPHAWRNISDRPARWFEVRAPQPKIVGEARGTYASPQLTAPESGRPAMLGDPTCRFVGHFEDDQMSPYGPIASKGIVNYCIKHISTRVLVEDTLGAVQHITFMAQLPPAPTSGDAIRDLMEADPLTKSHYHQYEEVYYLMQGRGLAYLDGQTHEVTAGDVILAGVGGSHALINIGEEPLRWLETQAPRPPEQHGAFWEKDWAALAPLKVVEGRRP